MIMVMFFFLIIGERARLRENSQFSAQPKQSISNVLVVFRASDHLTLFIVLF